MRSGWVLLLLLLQTACAVNRGGGYYEDDGPPRRTPRDLARIADAEPRREAISKSGNRPYTVFNKTYYPRADAKNYRERGVASWYGKKFHGRRTSSGERYDMYAMSAAHKTLPIPSYVRVRNLRNGKTTVVRVNDRGPFLHNRLIDLSYAAAAKLDIVASGTGLVEIESIDFDAPAAVAAAVPPAPIPAPAAAPDIFIQVGAYIERDNAERMRSELYRAGFSGVHISTHPDQVTLYRVRVGPLASVDESDDLLRRLLGQGFEHAYIAIE